jgi:hypothetical protein
LNNHHCPHLGPGLNCKKEWCLRRFCWVQEEKDTENECRNCPYGGQLLVAAAEGWKMEMRDRVIRFFKEGFEKEEIPYSEGYSKFPQATPRYFFFVGPRGEVRAGASWETSVNITSSIQANMKMWEEKQGY